MTAHDDRFIAAFDFSDALQYGTDQRMQLCVDHVRRCLVDEGTGELLSAYRVPPIPPNGSDESELLRLEANLGVTLPTEYRSFLSRWRYLVVGDGIQIWGLAHNGITIGGPWVSDTHRVGTRYLVFADYWNYADGDQLMFDLDDPTQSVVAYLHEHGPSFESFAPSFSLALWRMVHEEV